MRRIFCVLRRRQRSYTVLVFAIVLAGLCACSKSDEARQFYRLSSQPATLYDLQREQLLDAEPVRALQALDAEFLNSSIVLLGRQLFHDQRLSGDGSLSCASCHDVQAGGDDGRTVAVGIRGQLGTINTPTVLNSGHSYRQFWDGRANSLAQQALGPIVNSVEMGANWPAVLSALSSDDELMTLFDEAFGAKVLKPGMIAEALAAFERTLITPAPFDRYLKGEMGAISDKAAAGYDLFKAYGCIACHQGVNLGGNVMQYFGAFHSVDANDDRQDMHRESSHEIPVYKVPTLRNVALTSPYFHTGSVNDLGDAVKIMGAAQLGRLISAEDIELLVAFLESLTGQVPPHALAVMPATRTE